MKESNVKTKILITKLDEYNEYPEGYSKTITKIINKMPTDELTINFKNLCRNNKYLDLAMLIDYFNIDNLKKNSRHNIIQIINQKGIDNILEKINDIIDSEEILNLDVYGALISNIYNYKDTISSIREAFSKQTNSLTLKEMGKVLINNKYDTESIKLHKEYTENSKLIENFKVICSDTLLYKQLKFDVSVIIPILYFRLG